MAKRRSRVSPSGAAARLARWRWHRNPVRGVYAGPCYRLSDGDVVTAAQLRRMFMGKIPGPAQRRLLGIAKVKKNPLGGRHLAQARGRIVGKNLKAYRRAFVVVRKRTGLDGMPALPWSYSPAHRVWGKALKLKQRAAGPGATHSHLRGRGYGRELKRVRRNPGRRRYVAKYDPQAGWLGFIYNGRQAVGVYQGSTRRGALAGAKKRGKGLRTNPGSKDIRQGPPRVVRAPAYAVGDAVRYAIAGTPYGYLHRTDGAIRVWNTRSGATKQLPKYRSNPLGGRRAARARCRIVSRATLRARINKASGGARNAVMRSILAQVMAGKIGVRGKRISAAVSRGIRRGRKNPKRKYVFTRARRLALKKARYARARGW
jgi:hypothetical protein